MIFTLYSGKKRKKLQFLKGVSKGLSKKHKVLWNIPYEQLTHEHIVMLSGILHGNEPLIEYCDANCIRYLYMDNAYYTPLKEKYYSVSLNSPQTLWDIGRLVNNDYNIPYKPYDMTGTYVLFIPFYSDYTSKWMNINLLERTENAIKNIREYTDLPIKVRFKPGLSTNAEYFKRFPNIIISTDSLQTDLKNCVCVYSSISRTSLEALSVGKPFICDPRCFAAELSQPYSILRDGVTYDEEKIKKFLVKVKNSQFKVKDLHSGKFYKQIVGYIQ